MRLAARLLTGGAGLAGGFPIWLWVIAGLLVALGGLEVMRRLQVASLETSLASERQGRADDHTKAKDAALRQAELNARETARRLERQQEAQNHANTQLAAALRDRDAARGVALRLSQRLDTVAAAARAAASDPAASAECKATASDAVVLADMLRGLEARGRELAAAVDASRIAGQQCEASYDSLTLKPSKP